MPLPEGEEMDTRPYFAKRNDMMVNILKNMRKEIAAAKQVNKKLSLVNIYLILCFDEYA